MAQAHAVTTSRLVLGIQIFEGAIRIAIFSHRKEKPKAKLEDAQMIIDSEDLLDS